MGPIKLYFNNRKLGYWCSSYTKKQSTHRQTFFLSDCLSALLQGNARFSIRCKLSVYFISLHCVWLDGRIRKVLSADWHFIGIKDKNGCILMIRICNLSDWNCWKPETSALLFFARTKICSCKLKLCATWNVTIGFSLADDIWKRHFCTTSNFAF